MDKSLLGTVPVQVRAHIFKNVFADGIAQDDKIYILIKRYQCCGAQDCVFYVEAFDHPIGGTASQILRTDPVNFYRPLAITSTCREIRLESLDALFSGCTLVVPTWAWCEDNTPLNPAKGKDRRHQVSLSLLHPFITIMPFANRVKELEFEVQPSRFALYDTTLQAMAGAWWAQLNSDACRQLEDLEYVINWRVS